MKRKRKRKRNLYWTQETEQAIIEYNICEDELQREDIFNKNIYKPLDKLAENIINRFKFPYMDGTFEDVKNEVVSYLVLKLPNFTADKGKSFSYFSVVAKNYCILQNNKRYKEEKKVLHLSDKSPESYSVQETLIIDPEDIYNEPERVEFIKLFIKYWDYNLHKIFPKKRDLAIAYAILELLKRAQMIHNFNKKAIYLMIREITDCETSHITKIVKQVKEIKDKQYEEYKTTGMIHDYFDN
jgi:hypothetical protein